MLISHTDLCGTERRDVAPDSATAADKRARIVEGGEIVNEWVHIAVLFTGS